MGNQELLFENLALVNESQSKRVDEALKDLVQIRQSMKRKDEKEQEIMSMLQEQMEEAYKMTH